MKQALIVQGGWQGHEPQLTSRRFAHLLEKNDYHVTLADTLDVFADLNLADETGSDRHLLDHGQRSTDSIPRTSARPWGRHNRAGRMPRRHVRRVSQ